MFKVNDVLDYSVVHNFPASATDGIDPEAGLVEATNHNLYGVTLSGGTKGKGIIYSVAPDGQLTDIFDWAVKTQPQAAMVQHTNGTLYGVSYQGGNYGLGVVYSLNLGLGPFVTLASSTGKAGQAAQILGQGLSGATGVTFNGVAAASFNVVSDTYMTAVVPAGATTGPVVVTTPTGALTSNKNFRMFPGRATEECGGWGADLSGVDADRLPRQSWRDSRVGTPPPDRRVGVSVRGCQVAAAKHATHGYGIDKVGVGGTVALGANLSRHLGSLC